MVIPANVGIKALSPAKTGVHPHPRILDTVSNGMADADRHLNAGFRRHDGISHDFFACE
jgi:hypothetical protein